MRYLSKFKLNESISEISDLKKANDILRRYINGPEWNEVLRYLNEEDVEYGNWTDIEILIYYLENRDK
jgi:hypothetical protein